MNKRIIVWSFVLILLSSVCSAAFDDDLIYWHEMDEGSGGLTDQHTGFTLAQVGTVPNQTGLNGGVDWSRGAYASSQSFLNSSQNHGLTSDGNFTVMSWIQYDGAITGYDWIVQALGAAGTLKYYLAVIDAGEADVIRFGVTKDGEAEAQSTIPRPSFATGAWYQIIGVYNNSVLTIYLNGTAGTPDTNVQGSFVQDAGSVTIGSFDGAALHPADGFYIDKVALWNRTLTYAEMTALKENQCTYSNLSNCDGLGPTPTTNINVTLKDDFNNTAINTYSINLSWQNGTLETISTTNGSIDFNNVSENDLSINVTFYGVNNYYNQTINDVSIVANTTNAISGSIYQAVANMQATEKISGTSLSGGNFFVGSKSGSIFNLTAATHVINFTKTNYYDLNGSSFVVSALTNTTKTISGVYSGIWNLTVLNIINGSVVPSFDINITSLNHTSWVGENSSSSTGSYLFNGINGTYQAIIDAAGYAPQTFNFSINDTAGAANFTLYTTNSINFTFYNEETKALLSGYNISVELIGDIASYNYTTATGYLYVDILAPQTYTIRYDDLNDTFGERFYYFNLSNRTNNAIDLYLLNNGTAGYSTITSTVYDETNHFVEGAIIKALRYYIDTNSYIAVDMARTNFEGVATLNLKQNEEFYKFIIEYPMGTTKKTTEPTQIYADTLNFQILLGTATGARWYKSIDTIANITFDEANNWFRLEWNDPENTLSQICMHTNLITNFRNQTINNSCSSSVAGIMYHPVNNVTGYTYHSTALAYYSNPPAPVAAAYHTFTASNPIGALGLFMLALITIVFVFIGFWNPAVAVVLAPLPTVLASVGGLVAIPPYVTVPIEIVAIIIAYIISTRA